MSSFFDGYGIIINTQHNKKPICRKTNVCGIVSIEACKQLLEADNPTIIAKEGFSLTNEDIVELHLENIRKYNSEKTQNIDYDLTCFPEMYSFDMLDGEKQVGDMHVSIHRQKTAECGEKQIYPDSWFVEGSNILKPVLEIDGFGTIENQGAGYGRAGLQRAYEMSIEKGCEGRIEEHATWGAGSFYEHCGFSGKNKGEPGIKYFDPTQESIASLYKGGKRENLILEIAKPIDLRYLNLDELSGEFIDPNELSPSENIETFSHLQEEKSSIQEIQKVLKRKQDIENSSLKTTTNITEINHSKEQTPKEEINTQTSTLKYLKEITIQNR